MPAHGIVSEMEITDLRTVLTIVGAFLALGHIVAPAWKLYRTAPKTSLRSPTMMYAALAFVWGSSYLWTVWSAAASPASKIASLLHYSILPPLMGVGVMWAQAFFSNRNSGLRWRWGLVGTIWGGWVLLTGIWPGIPTDLYRSIALVGSAALWGVALITWGHTYARQEWAFRRNRMLYWMWAAIFLLLGQMLVLFGVPPIGVVGLLLHLSGVVIISTAATQRSLPNVRAILRHLIYLLWMVLLVAVFLITVGLALSVISSSTALSVVGIATLAILWVSVYPLIQRGTNRLVERLIPRISYDPNKQLREYSLAIANIIDLDQLAEVVTQTVNNVLKVERSALILVQEQSDRVTLLPLKGIGEFPLQALSFEVHNPLVEHMHAEQGLLFQHNVEHDTAFHNLLPQIQAWFQQMGMEIYVPIFTQNILTGILAVGPPHNREPFSQQDQMFLRTLANQTAMALQNARIVENMRKLTLDITQLNQDLQQANERAAQLDRAKSDFLTIVSHELRTPLTHVKGYADVLAELSTANALTPEQIVSITNNISRAVDRLEAIIKAIMELAAIERDEMDLLFAPTTLAEVMESALKPWLRPIQIRHQRLKVTGVEKIPPIKADHQRLSQAFSNLVSNAIKYTPDGGQITIQARMLSDGYYEVIVSDTGIGINHRDQVFIFDKFYSVGDLDQHSSGQYSFKGGGPGLGLSIARGIIEAHSGRIWVVSPGHDESRCPGSEFHVVLPLDASLQKLRWPGSDSAPASVRSRPTGP